MAGDPQKGIWPQEERSALGDSPGRPSIQPQRHSCDARTVAPSGLASDSSSTSGRSAPGGNTTDDIIKGPDIDDDDDTSWLVEMNDPAEDEGGRILLPGVEPQPEP
jgi:hypothetical protein